MRFAADYRFKPTGQPYPSGRSDFIAICLTKFSCQSSSKILGSVNSWPAAPTAKPERHWSYGRRLVVNRNIFTMNTKFLTIVSVVGVALFCVGQAQSQPPPTSVSTGRTTEQATRPEAPGGGHGQVWVNTEARVYHREGSPFYGTTSKGRYMTEQDAIQAGYKRAPKTP